MGRELNRAMGRDLERLDDGGSACARARRCQITRPGAPYEKSDEPTHDALVVEAFLLHASVGAQEALGRAHEYRVAQLGDI